MGRRDAVQVVLEVIAYMRAMDPRLVVTYEPGWETRGNGTSANYSGGIWHHTAGASSATNPFPSQRIVRDGRPDLSGPLCNFAGPWCSTDAPRIHVVSANPANHAGASGGRSMGPLPVTSLFNPVVLGLEIDYAGVVPMTPGQAYVAQLWGQAVAHVVGGGDINRVRGHYETSVTSKWDPGYANGKTIDLNSFRRDAASLTPSGGFLMALTDAQQAEIYNWLAPVERYAADGKTVIKVPIRQEVADIKTRVLAAPLSAPAQPAPAPVGAVDYDRIISGLADLVVPRLADELDRRARDGDPATGPTS